MQILSHRILVGLTLIIPECIVSGVFLSQALPWLTIYPIFRNDIVCGSIWKLFDVRNFMLSTMFQPHVWIITHNHIGAGFPRFKIQFAEDFLLLILDNFWIDGWWEVWDTRVGGSMLRWVQVLWYISQALWLTFDIFLLVE